MKVEKIGSRGTLFTFAASDTGFPEECCVYLINGKNRVYLCDTHLGPGSMAPVREYIRANGMADKELVVFLTHADYDHIWGACAFPGATVAAHEGTLERIYNRGSLELRRYGHYKNGDVKLVYPTLTFDGKISFREDGVEFIHAPGHTSDSALCHDRADGVLFVGDLVERPRPVIQDHDLERYIDNLERIREMEAKIMLSSHSGRVTARDIEDNIGSIHQFQDMLVTKPAPNETREVSRARKLYTLLLYEDAIAQTAGNTFDYEAFQKELWDSLELDYLSPLDALLDGVEHEELKLALESYLAGL